MYTPLSSSETQHQKTAVILEFVASGRGATSNFFLGAENFTWTLRVIRSSTITRHSKREWLTHTPRLDPKNSIFVRLRCLRGPVSSSSPVRRNDLRSGSSLLSAAVMLLVLALLGMLVCSELSIESRGSSSAVLSAPSMEKQS